MKMYIDITQLSPCMEIILIILLLLYNIWLVSYLIWERRPYKSTPEADEPNWGKNEEEAMDIVGKSLFKMMEKEPIAATLLPQAATSQDCEEVEPEQVTFADETGEPPSARLPEEKLDEVFTTIRISDIPVAYGEEEPEEEVPTSYATGISFEEIDAAVRTAKNPAATDHERLHAGNVFSQLEGNELFDRLSKASSTIGSKIMELMDYHFSLPDISRDGEEGEVVVQLQNIDGVVVPDSIDEFDIRRFV